MKHRIMPFLAVVLLALMSAPAAFAACSAPAGNASDAIYNGAFHVYQFCNGTNWLAMGPQGSGSGSGGNTVFVTSATHNGLLGGVSGANAICAAAATAASLSGTFKAWIAVTTGTDDPATTFTQSTIPYKDVLGNTIASNWAGLISGTLTNGISYNETGTLVTGGTNVWTNVATNGTASASGSSTTNCLGFTTNANFKTAVSGSTGSTTSTWTVSGNNPICPASYPLYCFQQDGTAGGGCTSPTGNEGDMIYNSASHVYQFCGGTTWLAMGPQGSGSGGCTSPTGNEADILYNSAHNVMQYCNGTAWVAFY